MLTGKLTEAVDALKKYTDTVKKINIQDPEQAPLLNMSLGGFESIKGETFYYAKYTQIGTSSDQIDIIYQCNQQLETIQIVKLGFTQNSSDYEVSIDASFSYDQAGKIKVRSSGSLSRDK